MSSTIENGILHIGGVSCEALAKACGTPLYIYDENEINNKLENYLTYFKSEHFETEIIYASKAFSCKALLQIVNQHGCGADVVSGGELHLVYRAGLPMNKVYFHGNNKTEEEIEMAFSFGCKTIIADNLMECEKIIEIANRNKKYIDVLIRVNPEISAHTHQYIITGNTDSKFGVLIHRESTLIEMIHMIQESSFVTFKGFHCHIGSQIFDMRAYEFVIERMVKLIRKINTHHNIEVEYLNLGGGFGVRYTEKDQPHTIKEICECLIKKCESELEAKGMKLKKIMIEPGRTIVAEAGYTLYRVGFMKETPNISYLFVDGGMSDNMRVALYQAKYECDIANKINKLKQNKYSIAGKCCESGDILIEGAMLPEAEQNDLLVVYGTGAYGYAMANNYNRMRKPAVVFVKDGKARVVIERESYESLMDFETNVEVNL